MRKDFITAYIVTFGATKKEAGKVYADCMKKGQTGYISAIIEGFKRSARSAFYND